MKNNCVQVGLPGFEFQPCHLPAAWPWARGAVWVSVSWDKRTYFIRATVTVQWDILWQAFITGTAIILGYFLSLLLNSILNLPCWSFLPHINEITCVKYLAYFYINVSSHYFIIIIIITIIVIVISFLTNLGSHTKSERKLRLETKCPKSQCKGGSI